MENIEGYTPEEIQGFKDGFTLDPTLPLNLLRDVYNVKGDVVEVGVHQAQKYLLFLDEAEKQDKICHGIDSFRGFDTLSKDDIGYSKGQLDVGGADWLRILVANRKQAIIHEGWIPNILWKSKIHQISFIHIDVDLYLPTKQTMEWAWPLLAINGIMICHDYIPNRKVNCSKAIDEFIKETGFECTGLVNTWGWWIKKEVK